MSYSRNALLRGSIGILALLATSPSLASPITIRGSVAGSGPGVERISVALVPTVDRYEDGRLLSLGRAHAEAAEEALAGKDGRFRLIASTTGMWQVTASAEGHLPMVLPLHPLLEDVDLPRFELTRDEGLQVRVVDAHGTGVKGARVVAIPQRSWSLEDLLRPSAWRPAVRVGMTGEHGKVRLPRAAGESLSLEILAAGFPPAAVETRGARITVTLEAGVERRVEVQDDRRRPVEGAQLRIAGFRTPSTVTDERGRATVFAPRAPVEVDLLGSAGERAEGLLSASAPDAEPQRSRFVLESPSWVRGRVLGLPDRLALGGAFVWEHDNPGGFVRTDGHGQFSLPMNHAGELRLVAAEPRYFTQEAFLRSETSAGALAHSFALEPRTAVVGVVLDEAGRPLDGVEVRAWYDPATKPPGLRHRVSGGFGKSGGFARSREEGRFRVSNLTPEIGYELRFSREGYSPRTVRVAAPAPGSPSPALRVTLAKGIVASGLVVTTAEDPVRGALVELRPAGDEDPLRRVAVANRPDAPAAYAVYTGSGGSFTIGDLPAGRFDLRVEADGFARARIPGVELREGTGGGQLGTVILAPEAVVEGFVRDRRGSPLDGVAVRWIPEDPLEAFIADVVRRPEAGERNVTAGDGHFRVDGLRHGEAATLELDHPGFVSERISTRAPTEQPLEIALRPASRIQGSVVTADREPVAGALVVARKPKLHALGGGQAFSSFEPSPLRARTRNDGSFELTDIEPGRIDLSVTAAEKLEKELDVTVSAGQDLEGLEIVLEDAAVVTGQVFSPAGDALAHAEIRKASGELPPGAIVYTAPLAVTDGEGRYRIESIRPGMTRLEAEHDAYQRSVQAIEAMPGENRLDFTLEGGASVSGYVLDGQGIPVGGARVHLRTNRASWSYPQARTRPEGSFRFDGLASGSYELTAEKDGVGRSERPVPVRVENVPVEDVEVGLTPAAAITGTIYGLDIHELASVELQAGGLVGIGAVSYDGSYRIADLSPGRWSVVARLPRTGRYAEGEVTLEGGEEAALDLDFGSGLVLSGQILLDGEPLARAGITALRTGGTPIWGETGGDGHFRFEGLSPGEYVLEISDLSAGAVHRDVVELSRDREVVITLRTDAMLR